MKRSLSVLTGLFLILPVSAQSPTKEPPKVELNLPDQFDRKQDLSQFRGDVVVILYGDREGARKNQAIGEQLHVEFHPAAKGQTGQKAAQAPVVALENLPEGQRSPDVKVLPVACVGKVPNVVKTVIRNQVKKEASDTIVMLDFEDRMKETFGLTAGEPNLVVIDAEGRLRFKVTGKLEEKSYTRLLEVITHLRKEAAGMK